MSDPNPSETTGTRRPGNLPLAIPFIESLGTQLIEMADGRALATMTPRAEHMNSWSVVHGGVLMSLLDFVMAMAGRCAYDDRSVAGANAGGNLTVELKTSFVRPAQGVLTIKAHCIHAGRSLNFCEGEILDAEGLTVARASGTFKLWRVR